MLQKQQQDTARTIFSKWLYLTIKDTQSSLNCWQPAVVFTHLWVHHMTRILLKKVSPEVFSLYHYSDQPLLCSLWLQQAHKSFGTKSENKIYIQMFSSTVRKSKASATLQIQTFVHTLKHSSGSCVDKKAPTLQSIWTISAELHFPVI